jgi:serine/threonine protein kinase
MSIAPQLIEFSGASEFEVSRFIGSLGFRTIVDWEYDREYAAFDPLAPKRTVDSSGGAQVRLYDARCISRNPRLYNARVQLKEFLTGGMELGVNEAEAYQKLYDSKGGTPMDPNVVPVATLLGSFVADASFGSESFAESWARNFPRSPQAPRPGSPWLVFRYEGNLTAARFPSSPRGDSPGGRLVDRLFPQSAFRRRVAYLVQLMRKSLLALEYLHTAGLVHRSLSGHSLLVNTVEDRLASSLEVKIRDFGFAKSVSDLLTTSDELAKARRAGAETPAEISAYFMSGDIYDLGYAFCELIFGSLAAASSAPPPDASQDRFKSLFEDTFELSTERFRDYCDAEPAWEPAVRFLDLADRAGWTILRAMLGARQNYRFTSLGELIASPLLTPVKRG